MPASRSLPAFIILALALTGPVHSPTGTAPIVTDGMTTGEFGQIPEKASAMEKAKSCGRRMWEEGKPFSLEELAGAAAALTIFAALLTVSSEVAVVTVTQFFLAGRSRGIAADNIRV
jgi:hypothetical protein